MSAFRIPSPQDLSQVGRNAIQALKEYVDAAVGPKPNGVVGFVEATASTWSPAPLQTDETDITGTPSNLSLTLELSTARRYKAVCNLRLQTTVAGDAAFIRFVEGGVNRKIAYAHLGFTTNAQTVHSEWVFVPASSASTVYKVRGARNIGTGTITLNASATTPAQFWIEDVGPA